MNKLITRFFLIILLFLFIYNPPVRFLPLNTGIIIGGICFVFYFGFEGVSGFAGGLDSFVASLGMEYHFKSMSRGVLDTRDIIYFLSITILFLSFTVYKLKSLKG